MKIFVVFMAIWIWIMAGILGFYMGMNSFMEQYEIREQNLKRQVFDMKKLLDDNHIQNSY